MAEATGLLMYGIVPGGAAWRPQRAGVQDRPVKLLECGPLAALVSDVPNQRIRPERRHISAFESVLKEAMQEVSILPMAFGMIAESEQEVHALLDSRREVLCGQLERLNGKMEMGLTVHWDVPNVFNYFIERSPELREMRDRVFGGGATPTTEQKIELGRLFDEIRNERRQQDSDAVCEVLRQRWEVVSLPARSDHESVRLACLIGRDERGQFEEAVGAAAADFDDTYGFRIDGPWPPHNFCNIRVTAPTMSQG